MKKLIVMMVVVALAASANAGLNLLVNGDFESFDASNNGSCLFS
jgi:hypothetical protein